MSERKCRRRRSAKCSSKLKACKKRLAELSESTDESGANEAPAVENSTVKSVEAVKNNPVETVEKMAVSGGIPLDLHSAVPIAHSDKEFEDIIQYANNKGINVYDVKKFDGDISVLKDQIDALHEVRQEYALSDKLTITFRDMSTGDLAETNREGSSIVFDRSALRSRDLTNKYLSSDDYLATNDVKGIGYHETGHLISKKYGEKGFDIAKQAYYNIYRKNVSNNELLNYLRQNISIYSVFLPKQYSEKAFKPKYYKEITPEILSKDKTNSNEFTQEFIRLLKGACDL